ncbi:MAG TPA: efflux RND transporter periplasmic adaptor subunit [Pseudomonadales bacterium]|nr:efflux RND transporter periplasmic adaptor subunit [Pseudomonadales bacterium]
MADKRNGSGLWIVFVAVALVVVIGGGFLFFKRSHDDAPTYQTVPIARGDLTQTVTATGTLNPVTNVLVGCQVSGTISKIYVDYNSIVTNGQLIAELDPSQYRAQLQQAEANLANAKANLELQQAQADRESQLFTNKLVSGSDYDTAIATLHEAEASVQLDQAAVNIATVNLGYCKIYSPVDGIVIVNNIEVGQTVAASFNTPELFQIANNLKQMQIDSSVAEADVGGVVDEQDVDFTVDAYPYRTFHGSVTQVRNSPTTVNNVVTYDCVISVTNADYKLKPGMTANVSIIVAQRKDTVLIPNGALRFRPPEGAIIITNTPVVAETTTNSANSASAGKKSSAQAGHHQHGSGNGGPPTMHTVYLLTGQDKDARLEAVHIKTGITDGIFTEVVNGLNEGDKIVTGSSSTTASAAPGGSPFGGGGFPRMR